MTEITEKKRKRSPAYPAYSLLDCVKFIELLNRRNGLAEIPKTLAFKYMGLDPKKNDAFRAASSLTGFGLLEEAGQINDRVFKFTELGKAVAILKDKSEEKTHALQEAAQNYPIIKLLSAKWRDGLPSSDEVITLELLKQGFNERATDRFIPVLRDTLLYANLYGDAILEDEEEPSEQMESKNNIPQETISQKNQSPAIPKGFIGYTLTLAKGKEVRLLTSDNLLPDDIEFMLQWIQRLDLTRSEKNNE